MKRCPTCQRTYTDDSLSFCLQDGSLLLADTSASGSFDPSATLHLPQSTQSRSEPAQTAAQHPPRATVRDVPEAYAHLPQTKPQGRGLIVGLTVTVVVLLLALGSVGAWMLLRDDRSGETKGRTPPSDNQNSNASRDTGDGQSEASASPGASVKPTPQPSATAPPINTAAIREQVTATLNGWAAASMAHDIEKHMSYYADTLEVYYTNTNVSASRVRADRERAYALYSTIDITLSNIKVTVEPSGSRANATFDKTWNFAGSKYSSGSVRQAITLVNAGGARWLITGERDLQVYYVNK